MNPLHHGAVAFLLCSVIKTICHKNNPISGDYLGTRNVPKVTFVTTCHISAVFQAFKGKIKYQWDFSSSLGKPTLRRDPFSEPASSQKRFYEGPFCVSLLICFPFT